MPAEKGLARMADVFVSYKADDRKRVKPLVDALEADGLSVWWDERIDGGTSWRQTIEDELNAARSVVVVWSKRSVGAEGSFVQDEAARAQQRRVYVPVTIDRVSLPLGFGETHALPLVGWRGSRSDPRYRAVADAVRRMVGIESLPEGPEQPDRARVSRRAVLGTGVAAAAAMAIGGWALLKPGRAGASQSIAVLPFANLSGDPAQDYFSHGLAEEIRSSLSHLAGLQVVGRTSSEAVGNADARTAAAHLRVGNILLGSVRRSASAMRVSAQLIDGRSGLERWSQTYDRSHGDALQVQSDIARNVASALSIALGSAGPASFARGGTRNAAAQDLYLKAREQVRSDSSEESYRRAIGLFDAAIALDPGFANAYAQKSLAMNGVTGIYAEDGSFTEGYAQAEDLARQAIALAPDSPTGYIALAKTLTDELELAAAYPAFQKARALSQGDPDVLLETSEFATMLGKHSEAIDLARQAVRFDPLNPYAYRAQSLAFALSRRFPDAIAAARRGLKLAPGSSVLRSWLGYHLVTSNRFDEARAEFRRVPPDNVFRMTAEGVMHARENDHDASNAVLERMQRLFGETANYQYAQVYAQQGAIERAFDSLRSALRTRDPGLNMIRADPWIDPLRQDPRFKAIERELDFPEVAGDSAA